MRLQMRRIDHQRGSPAALIGQFEKHPGEDSLLAPSLPTAVECLVQPILRGRIAPTQAIAIDKDYTAQNPLIVHTGLAMGLREKGFQLGHLRIAQPVKVAHVTTSSSEPWNKQRNGNQRILIRDGTFSCKAECTKLGNRWTSRANASATLCQPDVSNPPDHRIKAVPTQNRATG